MSRAAYNQDYECFYQKTVMLAKPPPLKKKGGKKMVSSKTTKFSDLCEDVIRIVCGYLDAQSHIALYLAVNDLPCVREQMYQKIQMTTAMHKPNRTYTYKTDDCDLIAFIAGLSKEEKTRLTNACGGDLPLNLERGLNCFLPLLIQHDKIPPFRGKIRSAKAFYSKYGAMRANPEAYQFVEALAIKLVQKHPAYHLFEFVLTAFDLSDFVASFQPNPTNCTPGCFQTPELTLRMLCKESLQFTVQKYAVRLWKSYERWKKFYSKPRNYKGVNETILLETEQRYRAALKIMFYSLYLRCEKSYEKLIERLIPLHYPYPVCFNRLWEFLSETLQLHLKTGTAGAGAGAAGAAAAGAAATATATAAAGAGM